MVISHFVGPSERRDGGQSHVGQSKSGVDRQGRQFGDMGGGQRGQTVLQQQGPHPFPASYQQHEVLGVRRRR